VTPAGVLTSVAGSQDTGHADGTGSAAQFRFPSEVAVGPGGLIYVAEGLAHRVRKIASGNVVSTLAGQHAVSGLVDGPRASALFREPSDIVRDSGGNLFVADWANNRIRKLVLATTTISTVAGTGVR